MVKVWVSISSRPKSLSISGPSRGISSGVSASTRNTWALLERPSNSLRCDQRQDFLRPVVYNHVDIFKLTYKWDSRYDRPDQRVY